MRIFEKGLDYGKSINFVDINDVYVGYDFTQSCCESFGYYFTTYSPGTEPYEDTGEMGAEARAWKPSNLEQLVFDPSYCVRFPTDPEDYYSYDNRVAFRLVMPAMLRQEHDRKYRREEREAQRWGGQAEVFLVLYNYHNGYYGHGFRMKQRGDIVHKGGL